MAQIYYTNLSDTDYILPQRTEDYYHVYHIFNIRHKKRDEVKQFLLEHDIKSDIHYPIPPNEQNSMKGIISQYNTPLAKEIHNTTLSLPISFCHNTDDILQVCDVLKKFKS